MNEADRLLLPNTLAPAKPAERVAESTTGSTSLQLEASDGLRCRSGDPSCAMAHAAHLSRSPAESSAAARSILHLQRRYGNRFARQVANIARQAGYGEDAGADAAAGLEREIEHSRGNGLNLDGAVRAQMEPAFRSDFSGVRVHTDSRADKLNRSLSARAFTTGRDIFFSQGAYSPGSSSGRQLIAHELTHVVQQSGDEIRPQLTVSEPGDKHEVEAEHMAQHVMRLENAGVPEEKDETAQLQRQAEATEDEEFQDG